MTENKQSSLFDITITGAGLVGTLAAIAWSEARPEFNIALIDPAAGTPKQDHRTIALALRSQQYLAELGVWTHMSSHTAIQNIHVSDASGAGSAWLKGATEGIENLGFVAQAGDIQQALMQRLAQLPQVKLLKENTVTQITSQAQTHRLQLSSGNTIDTRLLAIADGSQSPTRQLAGIQTQDKPYHQVALVGFVDTDQPVAHIAYERFTAHGPLALLPADSTQANAHKRFAFIWCVAPHQVSDYLALPELDFRFKLQQLFGRRAGYFTNTERKGSFPLWLSMAERFTGHRTLVLGNAAHTLHPVAGQGYNLGLRDVASFQVLLAGDITDPGAVGLLQTYERARKPDYLKLQAMTDTLVQLFSNTQMGMREARRVALASLGLCSHLARPITQTAMGFGAYRTPKE